MSWLQTSQLAPEADSQCAHGCGLDALRMDAEEELGTKTIASKNDVSV